MNYPRFKEKPILPLLCLLDRRGCYLVLHQCVMHLLCQSHFLLSWSSIVWHSESTSEDVGIFADIAITSLGIAASAVLHAKLDLSSNLVSSLEVCTQIVGRQLHNALPKLLTNAKCGQQECIAVGKTYGLCPTKCYQSSILVQVDIEWTIQ